MLLMRRRSRLRRRVCCRCARRTRVACTSKEGLKRSTLQMMRCAGRKDRSAVRRDGVASYVSNRAVSVSSCRLRCCSGRPDSIHRRDEWAIDTKDEDTYCSPRMHRKFLRLLDLWCQWQHKLRTQLPTRFLRSSHRTSACSTRASNATCSTDAAPRR